MANLLEALNKTAPTSDTTSQISTLLRAKSGKALGGPTTTVSSQQEKAAQAETEKAIQPLSTVAQVQDVGQKQQEEQLEQTTQIQKTEVEQAREANKLQTQLRMDQLFQAAEQAKGKQDQARYNAAMEQVGQTLRLNTAAYTDRLKLEAERANIINEKQFNEQLALTIFGEKKNLFEKQLGNKSILEANDREFDIKLAQLDIDSAWALVQAEIQSQAEQARYESIGAVANVGLERYGKYIGDQDKRAYYGKGGAGENVQSYEASKYRKL